MNTLLHACRHIPVLTVYSQNSNRYKSAYSNLSRYGVIPTRLVQGYELQFPKKKKTKTKNYFLQMPAICFPEQGSLTRRVAEWVLFLQPLPLHYKPAHTLLHCSYSLVLAAGSGLEALDS